MTQDWECVGESPASGPNGYLRLLSRQYRLPDGTVGDWDLVDGGETVAVVAVTRDERVLLVRQFRPGPGRTLDELPGGAIEAGEEPREGASRELLEETGHRGSITIVGSTWLSAYATTRRFIAIAVDCVKVAEPSPDRYEFLENIQVDRAAFLDLIRRGELTDLDIAYRAADHLGWL